jgi:hypothetical protein
MFCPPKLIFGGTEAARSSFHVLRSRTCFRRYRGRQVQFSCSALPNPFSAVPRALGPVFMFYALGHVFNGTKAAMSSFHVLRSQTYFWRYRGVMSNFHILRTRTRSRQYRGRQVPFSCFVLPDPFSAVPRVSSPVYLFCAPRLIFGGTEADGSLFMFCTPELIFGGTEGVESSFHVLRFHTHFRRNRGRRCLPLKYFKSRASRFE